MSITKKLKVTLALAVVGFLAAPAVAVVGGGAAVAAPAVQTVALAATTSDDERWAIPVRPVDVCIPVPCWGSRCCTITVKT